MSSYVCGRADFKYQKQMDNVAVLILYDCVYWLIRMVLVP